MVKAAAPSSKGKLLKEQLELVSYTTFDGRSRYSIRPIEDTLSFDKGFFVFVRALQMLRSKNDGITMVGLAGPSGSGKTAFSEKVRTFWPGVAVISMDMYNQGDKVVDDNFDDPRITDYKTLLSNMRDLRDGKPTQVPIYDFKTSSRVGYRLQQPPSAQVVIIEGIYALSEQLRPLLDLRVSITGGVHFDLVKRVMRDISRSGQDAEGIISQITDTVYPMFKVFIEPALQTAQLRITNAFNPFAGFMSPTYMLKSNRVPELPAVKKALEEQGLRVVEKSAIELYDIYLVPPNQDAETCQSWLRMRNKDGRYSLLFEEWVTEGPFIISPRISFEVNVRVMGGLMSLGYEVGAVMRRSSLVLTAHPEAPSSRASISVGEGRGVGAAAAATAASSAAAGAGSATPGSVGPSPPPFVLCDPDLREGTTMTVKVDEVEALGKFVTILGKDREKVAALGRQLGLDGSYIPHSFIEQVQMYRLTNEFAPATADWKRRIVESSTGGPGAAVTAGKGSTAGATASADHSITALMSELMASPPRKSALPRASFSGQDNAEASSSAVHGDSALRQRRASLPGPNPGSCTRLHWVDPEGPAPHLDAHAHDDALEGTTREPSFQGGVAEPLHTRAQRPTHSVAASSTPCPGGRAGASTPASTPVSRVQQPQVAGDALPPSVVARAESAAEERLERLVQRLSRACEAQEAAAGKLLQAMQAVGEGRRPPEQGTGSVPAYGLLAGAAAVALAAFALGARLASRS